MPGCARGSTALTRSARGSGACPGSLFSPRRVSSSARIEEGLSALREALAETEETEARFYEAETYRLKGELVLASAEADESGAEASFRKAIALARRQDAKSWELRAATSLARLLARQERREEARDLLAPVYGWFTEGFDTADLKEAKALLDGLL